MQNPTAADTARRPSLADAHLALAMEAVDMGAWHWDIRANQVSWSSSLERMHGLEPGTFPGTFEAYQSDIHPDDRDRVLATISRSLEDREPHYLQYRIIRPDGDVRWLQARGRLLLDAEGQPERLVGVCMDVTSQREREIKWRDVERRQLEAEASLAEQTQLAALSRDISLALTREDKLADVLRLCVEAVVTHLGAAFARIWTLNEAEQMLELQASAGLYTHVDGPHGRVPVGKFKIGTIAEERRPHLTNAVETDPRVGDHEWAKREGMVAFAGYPLLVGDSLLGVLAMFARRPLSDADFNGLGTVANALAVGIARSRANEAIRVGDERFHLLARATNDVIWDWNFETGGLWWNENFSSAFGYRMDELEPGIESWTSRIHPDDLDRVSHGIHAVIDGEGDTWSDEYRFRRANGSDAIIFDRGIIVRDDNGRARRMMGSMMDITDSKRVEADLRRHAEHLTQITAALQRSNRDLDQFAYVASHDLKAPLRGIANLSQWIEEDLGGTVPDTTRGHLKLMRSRVQRMEGLIDGVLEYSRAGRVNEPAQRVAVARVVAEVVDLIAAPGAVRFDIAADLPVLHTDRLPLQQVFLNLIGNAIKHGAADNDPRVAVSARRGDQGYEFAVSDNGPGIDPAFHDKVWGIFQTLRPRDEVEGTGIGLALVKKIVESRGGRVWLESRPGSGARFWFSWPDAPAGEQL